MEAPFLKIRSYVFTTLLKNTYIYVDKYIQKSVTYSDNLQNQNYTDFLETAFRITVLDFTLNLSYQ